LRGIGTVVTGTLTDGQLHRGQSVIVEPQNFDARIRSIQSHGSEMNTAEPGMRTAINIPDVAIGDGPTQIKRGDVITVANLGRASSALVILLEKSPRLRPKEPSARPLKNGTSVYLHHGTSRFPARVGLFNGDALEPGKQAFAKLKLESPIFAFFGDRFVLRDASEQHTVAGGVVLDPDGHRDTLRDAAQHKLVIALAAAASDVVRCIRSEVRQRGFVLIQSVLRKSHFSSSEIAEGLKRLQNRDEIVIHGEIAADSRAWKTLYSRASFLIDDAHKRTPERAGLDLNDLRTALRGYPPDVFQALVSNLRANDFVRKGSAIARISHRPALPVNLQLIKAEIRETLLKKPFDPPARKEIELNREAQQVLRFLIENGEVVEVGSEVVLLEESFQHMKSAVIDFISKHGPATVSNLRQQLQTSRRIMVPFLEGLDRDGVTHRVGDKRMLASRSMTTASGALD
jgi:selenocysteine-specific elongation factor